ncbi:hypothetical protein P8605_38545, partial [Streptomyces sp. T-3]|nr:hypothetical protein [Streptomyces sp. T-3]
MTRTQQPPMQIPATRTSSRRAPSTEGPLAPPSRTPKRRRPRPGSLPALLGWGSIRGRVGIVLAVPTCLLLVVTGLGVADRAADWSAARETAGR